VRALRTNSGSRGVPFFGTVSDPVQAARTNPFGLADESWFTSGVSTALLSDNTEARFHGRWMFDWSPSATQQVAVGVEGEGSRISSYRSTIGRQIDTDIFTARPKQFGAFVQGRLRAARATVDLGLRYDATTPGADVPIVPGFISSSGAGLWNPSAATDDTAYTNSVARVFRRARIQSSISPRLAFEYPLSTETALRLGYMRTMEPPTWSQFFTGSNSDLSFADLASTLFGRDLDFVRASVIEAGVRSKLGPSTIDVALYRSDRPTYGGQIMSFHDPRDTSKIFGVDVLTVQNAHVNGLDVGLHGREGWLTATSVYSLAHTTAPGSSSFTTHDIALTTSIQAPQGWKSGTTLGTIMRDLNAVILARAQSGAAYTPLVNNGFGIIAPGQSGGQSHLPWSKWLDLRIAKTVRTGGHDWSVYVDARNLLNVANLRSVFAETGDTTNFKHRALLIGDPNFANGEYALLWDEAQSAGALGPGNSVDLTGCAGWSRPADCVALTRVERRFGNGDGIFTLAEQQRTFNAFYDDFFGAWRFYAPGRTIRVGMELAL
jgi:hypothetical protein